MLKLLQSIINVPLKNWHYCLLCVDISNSVLIEKSAKKDSTRTSKNQQKKQLSQLNETSKDVIGNEANVSVMGNETLE